MDKIVNVRTVVTLSALLMSSVVVNGQTQTPSPQAKDYTMHLIAQEAAKTDDTFTDIAKYYEQQARAQGLTDLDIEVAKGNFENYRAATPGQQGQYLAQVQQRYQEATTTVSIEDALAAPAAPKVATKTVEEDKSINNAHPAVLGLLEDVRRVKAKGWQPADEIWDFNVNVMDYFKAANPKLATQLESAYLNSDAYSNGVNKLDWLANPGKANGISFSTINSIGNSRARTGASTSTGASEGAEAEYQVPPALYEEEGRVAKNGDILDLRKRKLAQERNFIIEKGASVTLNGFFLDAQEIKMPLETYEIGATQNGREGNFTIVAFDYAGNQIAKVKVNDARSTAEYVNTWENSNKSVDGEGATNDAIDIIERTVLGGENPRDVAIEEGIQAGRKTIAKWVGSWNKNQQKWKEATPVGYIEDFTGAVGVEGRPDVKLVQPLEELLLQNSQGSIDINAPGHNYDDLLKGKHDLDLKGSVIKDSGAENLAKAEKSKTHFRDMVNKATNTVDVTKGGGRYT